MSENSNGPEIGDSFTFMPAAFTDVRSEKVLPHLEMKNLSTTGNVVQIHSEHRWFRVAYDSPSGILYECFKF